VISCPPVAVAPVLRAEEVDVYGSETAIDPSQFACLELIKH
jgi:hypothetical protein